MIVIIFTKNIFLSDMPPDINELPHELNYFHLELSLAGVVETVKLLNNSLFTILGDAAWKIMLPFMLR